MAQAPTTPANSDTEIDFKLTEFGNEFGLDRFSHETNAEFAHRLVAELEEMIAELRGTQTVIRQLIS